MSERSYHGAPSRSVEERLIIVGSTRRGGSSPLSYFSFHNPCLKRDINLRGEDQFIQN